MVKRPTKAATAGDPADETPEADRLEGAPHPRATVRLFGHEEAQRELAGAFAGGRMHHALLLTGREGIGKATLAYRFARYVLSVASDRRGAETDPLGVADGAIGARQVLALSHPGLLVIRREYDHKEKRIPQTISVDDVRRLKLFLSRTIEAESHRIVIVDRADDLNPNAANALLKSLEEPPARTLFLLVASEPGRLIRTIHSRCRTLPMEPLPALTLAEAANQALVAAGGEPIAAADAEALAQLAGGSVRRALSLHRGGGLEQHRRLLQLLAPLPRIDLAGVHKLAGDLSGNANEQAFHGFFAIFGDLLSRIARSAATGRGALGSEEAVVARFREPPRLSALAEAWETIEHKRVTTLALNLDRRTLIIEAFDLVAQAAR